MGKSVSELGFILCSGASFEINASNYSASDLGFLIEQAKIGGGLLTINLNSDNFSVSQISFLADIARKGGGLIIIYGAGKLSARDLGYIAEQGRSSVKFKDIG